MSRGKRPKPGRPLDRRPLKPFDCVKPFFPPPESAPHYGVAVFVHKAVVIVAVGTTKHADEDCFLEVDADRSSYGLPDPTRFLDRFVHAHWYGGAQVDVYGRAPGGDQLAFKKAAERALLAHARGAKIPTMPDRTEIAALRSPTVADPFFLDLHELAARTAAATTSVATAAPVPSDPVVDRDGGADEGENDE